MPTISVKDIYYVSSEDPNFPAANLLSSLGKKWKCKETGEKSVYVVLELDKPYTINGIDIGNEHSAYVQIFVNKKGASDDKYEEILLTSSFMTPMECRDSTTTNRVRCFSQNSLVESTSEKKWNLIKVRCTQPYNKHVQYGLSFIKIHGVSNELSQPSTKTEEPKVFTLGKFKMREESSDSDSNTSTSLFSRWKQKRDSDSQKTTASEIRSASISTSSNKKNSRTLINQKYTLSDKKNSSFVVDDDATSKLNRNRNTILYDDEDDKPNEKLDKRIEVERLRAEREKEKQKLLEKQTKMKHDVPTKKTDVSENMKISSNKFKNFVDNNETTGCSKSTSPVRDKEFSKKKEDKQKYSIFGNKKNSSFIEEQHTAGSSKNHKGEENNERKVQKRNSSPPQEREAKKFKPDDQSKKKYKPFKKLLNGIVLVISGIQNPERSNLRQKAVDMGARYKPDWDDTCTHLICAFKNTPKYNQVKQSNGKIINKKWIHDCYAKRKRFPWRRHALDSNDAEKSDSDDSIYDETTKPTTKIVEPSTERKPETPVDEILGIYDKSPECDSGEDTEEELIKVQEKNNNVFEISTDEESEYTSKTNSQTTEKEFFNNLKFYLSYNISSIELIKLENFIKMYKGDIIESVLKSDFLVTTIKIPVPENYKGELVKPLWIFECNDMESKLPTRRYKFE